MSASEHSFEYNALMAIIPVEANQCDECGHVWLPSAKASAQCASSKCRSRLWNKKPIQVIQVWLGGAKQVEFPPNPEVLRPPKKSIKGVGNGDPSNESIQG